MEKENYKIGLRVRQNFTTEWKMVKWDQKIEAPRNGR